MLIVDASCLAEVLIGGPDAQVIRDRMAADSDHAAPHIIDVEVFGVVRREHLQGRLDHTAASQAVHDLEAWPGQHFGHAGCRIRTNPSRDGVGQVAWSVTMSNSFPSGSASVHRPGVSPVRMRPPAPTAVSTRA